MGTDEGPTIWAILGGDGWWLRRGTGRSSRNPPAQGTGSWETGPFAARPWAFAHRTLGPRPARPGRGDTEMLRQARILATGRRARADDDERDPEEPDRNTRVAGWAAGGRHVATSFERGPAPGPVFLLRRAGGMVGPAPLPARHPDDPPDRDPAGAPPREGDPEGADPRGVFACQGGVWRARARLDALRAAGVLQDAPRGWPGAGALEGAAALVAHAPHMASPGALVAAGFLTPEQAWRAAPWLEDAWARVLG